MDIDMKYNTAVTNGILKYLYHYNYTGVLQLYNKLHVQL